MDYNFEWNNKSISLDNDTLNLTWRLVAKEGSCQWATDGHIVAKTADLDGYTSYEDITKDKLTAWVESCLGSEKYTYYKDLLADQFSKEHGNPGHEPKSGYVLKPWSRPMLSALE